MSFIVLSPEVLMMLHYMRMQQNEEKLQFFSLILHFHFPWHVLHPGPVEFSIPHKHEHTPSSPLVQDQSTLITGATPGKEWKREIHNCILDGRSMPCEPITLGDGTKLLSHRLFQMMCSVSAAPEHQSAFRHVRQTQ